VGHGTFTVWPCNWPTVHLFLHCQSTWERTPMIVVGNSIRGDVLIRMNYDGVHRVLNARCQARKRKREFVRLQAMEFAALGVAHG
jgi:hypothetical protein